MGEGRKCDWREVVDITEHFWGEGERRSTVAPRKDEASSALLLPLWYDDLPQSRYGGLIELVKGRHFLCNGRTIYWNEL